MSEHSKHTKSFKLGLTGSIGMGKTTVAKEFLLANIPVWNADDVVANLYKKDGLGYGLIQSIVPTAVDMMGVNKKKLSAAILEIPGLLEKIEDNIHPLLIENRHQFIDKFFKESLLVFEIPLLYETKSDDWLDAVLVVTAPKSVQKHRVMKRKGMTKEKLNFLMSRQVPEEVKISRADYILNTNIDIQDLKNKVKHLIDEIKENVFNS